MTRINISMFAANLILAAILTGQVAYHCERRHEQSPRATTARPALDALAICRAWNAEFVASLPDSVRTEFILNPENL